MKQNGSKLIVLIGDFADWMLESCKDDIVWFGESIETRCALSAEKILEEELALHDADVVAVDGFDNPEDTIAMVRNIRSINRRVPIIAASSDQSHRRKLVEAGCNYKCPVDKFLPQIICGIFEVNDTL